MSSMDEPPAVDAGLCATCRHMVRVRSDRGAVFLRCKLSESDPRCPKYPTLPVIACDGYVYREPCEAAS